MKYHYNLTVEDIGKDEEILIISGTGATRNKETCLKSVRRDINQTIKESLVKNTENQS